MITPQYLQRMARYNRWQNESLYAAADALGDKDRRADRGSFFKSIHATLSHILWADELWMSRLADWDAPTGPSRDTPLYDDWRELADRRRATDARFITWADGLSQDQIDGDLEWYSGSLKRGMTSDRDLWTWFHGVATGIYAYRLNARVVMMGAAEDVSGSGRLRWEFANCLPIKLKAADLSSSSTEIGIEELHLNHEGMRLMAEGET